MGTCITCHAWNADRTLVAVCPNDETVRILDAVTWEEKAKLAAATRKAKASERGRGRERGRERGA